MQRDRVPCAIETRAASGPGWRSMKALDLVLTLLFRSLRALGRSRSEFLLKNPALRQHTHTH